MKENRLEATGEKCKRGQKKRVLEFVGDLSSAIKKTRVM